MKKEILIKILFVFYLTLFGQVDLNGQTTIDPKVDKVLHSDTIWFEVQTKSCWGGGTDLIKIFKQSGDNYSVRRLDSRGNISETTIDKIQLLKFGELFTSAMERDIKGGCTLSHKYILSSKKKKVSFKENYCREDFQPNKFLKQSLNIIE